MRIGYLTGAEYEERTVPGKKRPVWWVGYRFAGRLPLPLPASGKVASPAPAAERRHDPTYLREMVAEILGTLKDEHSIGFYTAAAKALPEDTLRNVLGGVRQMLREGSNLSLARKAFTASAKARARALGVPL